MNITCPRVLTVFVPLLAAAMLSACGGKNPSSSQRPPAQVGVEVMAPQAVPLVRDLVGRLSAYRSADVRARVSGVLLKREYDEGTTVRKGQILFQIDPAPLQATLDSARAALASAQADYTNKRIAAKRARDLAPKGFVSQSDLDNAEAAERTAAAAVKQARANVESAKINLGYATVRSPIDGRAGKQQVTEGALVGQSSATLLTTVDQIDPLYVNFTMSVDDLDRLHQAQARGSATLLGANQAKLRLTLPDGSTYGQPGTLDFSGTTVDPDTGAVDLRGVIPNPDKSLLPGMYTRLKVTFGTLKHVYLVPESALQRDTTGPYVLVLGKDDKIQLRRVQTAGTYQNNWIVTTGLDKGERLIVSGLARAQPGQPARIAKPSAPASTGKPAAAAGKH
ncbi:efflux RND transporter periplasmic adaptor subunit [Oleiagrimonas citrea]|uniref:Efflux RND transporter periplasmic adaptor subunit n=1 Tax=Oleiagrimonas citrea TaxID=1665687 RepID=A0A846ZF09_9GAMM|nr:efflux RND transporter periplasmic adaptor subunit [Oleiagrimonas citrea]NKZ37685.1 efflux RND transporter periplasmic adaptor subunit [Oleiagrimonas citrea]